jgi:hypothetical protein
MAALLARRDTDGLSLRALSEESGIPFGTLSWWSWRLRHGSECVSADKGGFVEVVTASRQSSDAVVRLDNGVAVEVSAGTDVTWLRELIAALRSC